MTEPPPLHLLHMDKDYMWRWFLLDTAGKMVSMSMAAYFTYAEAKRALDKFLRRQH